MIRQAKAADFYRESRLCAVMWHFVLNISCSYAIIIALPTDACQNLVDWSSGYALLTPFPKKTLARFIHNLLTCTY